MRERAKHDFVLAKKKAGSPLRKPAGVIQKKEALDQLLHDSADLPGRVMVRGELLPATL